MNRQALSRLRLVNERGEARMTPALAARLMSELDRPARIVTLEGVDGVFCEGLDLSLVSKGGPGLGDGFRVLLETIDQTPCPVIALVDGPALGGGCALAAVADLVLATPRATFGCPEVLWGLIPAVAFPYIARRMSPSRARLLALGVPAIDADAAHRAGLVDEIVGDLEAGLAFHSRRLLRGDPRAISAVKALSRMSRDEHYEATADRVFDQLLASDLTQNRIERLLDGDVPWGEDA